MLGKGVYGVQEAARLARVRPNTVRRWFVGRNDSRIGPVLRPDYPSVNGRQAVSFLDLVDLLVVGRFREARVPLQTVRRVYQVLSKRLQTTHPFGHQKLLTDGNAVFVETLDALGDKYLEEVLTRQRAFPQILRQYLSEIVYGPQQIAARWNIAPGVVVDPSINFGKPTIAESGVSTYVLVSCYRANNCNAEAVSDLFEVSPDAVLRAVAFEQHLAA
jgi:uncharacterized protein (DUF433 family)